MTFLIAVLKIPTCAKKNPFFTILLSFKTTECIQSRHKEAFKVQETINQNIFT